MTAWKIGIDHGRPGCDLSAFALFDTATRTLIVDAMAVPAALLGSPSFGEDFARAMREAVRAIDKFGRDLGAVFASWQREAAPTGQISKRRARRLRGRAKAMRRAGA
ncbi:hypothetical protein O4H52_01015 [Sphingomonadaceae bacterium G21617-S1]|nr:hypothetical protein [Sphingomonadaceae bacterium G21617-S1]